MITEDELQTFYDLRGRIHAAAYKVAEHYFVANPDSDVTRVPIRQWDISDLDSETVNFRYLEYDDCFYTSMPTHLLTDPEAIEKLKAEAVKRAAAEAERKRQAVAQKEEAERERRRALFEDLREEFGNNCESGCL